MRLHLPPVLRRALYLAISSVAVTVAAQTADAAVLFDGVGLQTYADFGQNCGRYVAGEVNAMLQAIRERDNGIVITYQSDSYTPYTIPLEQGMIDFSSASSTPVDAAVGYGFLATVAHNGVLNPTYTANSVGGQNAVHYSSIDFKRGTNFHMEAATDYKVSRLNKLVTDAQPSELYSGANPREELDGKLLYRTGSGAMELALIDDDGVWRRTQELEVPYTFATGGIVVVEWAEPASHLPEHDANFGIFHNVNPKVAEEIAAQPLPYRVRSGDSGSPTWVWNTETKTYQYISAAQSGAQYFNQDRGDLEWSKYSMEKFNVTPDLGTSAEAHSITLSAVDTPGEKISGVGDDVEVSTTPFSGTITYTNKQGELSSQKFIGIERGNHTWLDLSPVKDQVNWFNYGDAYFNAAKYGADSNPDKQFSYADLFVTNSLVFEAKDKQTYNVQLEADVDLGIGFVQFSKAANVDSASFKLKSNHLLESAGFAIDKGVTLELDMKATEERMVEWRKAGAGNLKITGSGDTNALLNVGGSGTVSLKRENGYAAYNVLASSGSTVVIDNLQQVYRDVTLGANGATLDLNGNDFTWNNSAEADGNGFKSLHLLMEKDIVTNKADTAVTITITDPGTEAFVGAFRDTKEGAINVAYNGNSENPWVMNTVFTNLQNNAASSFTVNQGSVVLQGINTIHGRQVLGKRPVNEFDWHYADAQMDVVIEKDAEFTLGSHARLKGDVTVKDGGVFNMTEYTTHQYEYVEGGVKMDDTYLLRDYYGLHGDINLQGEDSMLYVQFTPQHYFEDTDSQSVYTGMITGSGSMVVDTAGGSLKLTNAGNDFTGSKMLTGGTLIATGTSALGNTSENKWIIQERGVLVVEDTGISHILPKIAGAYEEEGFFGPETKYSNGVLALTKNEVGDAPDLSDYQQLIIGAVGEIQFGQKGTQQKLSTNGNNEWHLGGGGGDLYVNYMLNDADGVLVLGNQYTTGRVILTNSGNHFSSIELKGGVTLSYESMEALGGASLSLNYGNRILGDSLLINQLTKESNGVVLIDNMSTGTIDLSTHGDLSLAADKATTFTGSIDLGVHDTYRFGGGSGHLVLDTELTDGPGGARRNILVDAQFFTPAYADAEDFSSAGVVELTRVSQATGTVTVQGYDTMQIPDPDDPLYILTHFSTATLQLRVNDALVNAESILLKDGGFIDINGTSQTLHSLKNDYPEDVLHGAYGVKDDSEAQSGELVLNVTQAAVDKDLWDPLFCNLTVPTLTKTGDGELMMVNVNESSLFTIKDGTVYVYEVQALNSGGVTRVEGPGVLDVSELGEALVNKTIELNNGGTMLVGTDAVSGSITAREGTGTLNANGATANLDAAIGAAQDATLVLQYGRFTLKNAQNNAQGGTIDLQGGTLSLNNAGGVSIGGTLNVGRDATLINATGADEAVHVITRLNMENSATLNMEGNGKSLLWDIHRLDGNGTINWKAGNSTKSTLMLDGEGSFSGTLQVQGGASTQATPGLLLAHEGAAQNATVSLQGNSGTSIASLAVGAENVKIAGLNGNANSVVFDYVPTEASTLTTTGTGTYSFAGSIVANEGARLNLAMEGSGSQTYSGTVQARDVSVLGGTLALRENPVDITGNVTVARGATFATDQGLTLGSGQYLCSTGETGAAGSVNSAVTFNGGGLSFDAAGLNANAAALQFNNGVTVTGNVTVDFTNTSYLTAGSTLFLTDGYGWNLNNLTATGLDYLDATFKSSGNILQVSFSQTKGNRIWDGTTTQHTWSSSKFGQGGSFTSTDTAVFNDSAESTEVQMSGDISANALLFDNSRNYTVNTQNGTLSSAEVSLQGTGDVTLGAGVTITQTADIAAGSTLVLRDAHTLGTNARVDGAGTIALDTDETAYLDGKLTHIGCVEVRSGTLFVGQTLAADDLVIDKGANLATSTGSILEKNATVHSSGSITLEVNNGKTETLTNAIAAGVDGTAGIFEKVGAGTLNVTQTLVADTVRVSNGFLQTGNRNMVAEFLKTTKLLEVKNGAKAYIGDNAYTIPDQEVATDMVVDGGTLELAIAQNTTRTISGDLTINSGKLQKVDGGLIFTGTTTLGSSSQDQVTLAGNWGKSGTIFNGLVQGEGKVTLAKGNSVEKFTFNNAENTFSGEIKATAGTQLVAGHKTALAQASNINLENNSTLVLATGAVDIKSLNGSGSVEFSAADDSSSTTLNITDSGTFAGAVGGNISISKSGSNTFALTGESSQFNGDLYVKEGAMSLESGALGILGSASSVTVKENATLHLGGNASVVCPMDIQGTLSLGGNITSRDSVQLAATGHLAGGSHTLEANSLVIEGLGGTNVETAASQTLGAGSVLTAFGESADSITLQADAEAMIYVVNNVQDVTLTGESLTINLSGLGQTPRPGQWMGITLGDASHTASIGTGMLVECVIGDGQKMQGYYLSSSSGDSANRVFFQMEGVVRQDLIWDHSSNTNWSTTDMNWHTAEATATHVPFTQEANVTFESETCTANLTENISAGAVTLKSGANVTINGAGHSLTTGEIAGSGATLTITNSSVDKTTTVNGNADIGMLNVKGGTTVFAGGDADLGKITMQRGSGATTLKFSAKEGAVNEYFFDTLNMAPTNDSAVDWLIVDKGVTVHGTGNTLAADSTIHSAWGVHGGGLEVNGTLTTDSSIGLEANDNTAYIKGTGTINTAGLNLCNGSHTYIQDGITINITSDKGIFARNSSAAAASVHLKDATLQATTSDWEFKIGRAADSVTLEDTTTGTTFEAAANRTITVSKAMGGSGKLVKAGDGTLTLTAANTYSGGTTVNAGTLVASNASALGSGAVTLNGGTLDLTTAVNTGAFTMNGGTLALDGANWIASTGAIALNSGTLDLTGMSITSGQDYTLATGTGVTLNSGVTFTLAQGLQDHYKLTANGTTLMLTFIQPAPTGALIWDGTTNSNWSNSTDDRNWHTEGGQAGSNSFMEEADVFFASGSASVTLTDDIVAGGATFAAGAHVAILNGGEFEQHFNNVTIEEGASVSFNENCSTFITGTLALNGTVTNNGNDGYLEIAAGTVDAGATGVLAGEGMTYLSGVISNDGTVKLDHATLAGDSGAAITGDVVINGGDLYGTMTLGSEGSTVSVTEAFDITGVEEYTILGNVKLDNLSGAEFHYAEGEQDEYNNGFFVGMEVEVFTMDYDPEIGTPIDFRGTVTYKGMKGTIEFGVFSAYVEDYSTFHVNVATDTPENLSHALEVSAGEGGQLNKVHLVANGSKLAVDATASLPDLTVTSGEGAANLLQGGEAPHTLTVTNLTLDGKLSVGEDVTLKLDTQLSGTTPDLANLANAGGTVSVTMGNGDNVLTMDAGSTGSLELRSGYISYRSELGEQTLHLANGTQLWFGSNAGTKDDAVFSNDIVLEGNTTVRVYGSSNHSSATISGNVTGADYTLTKTDGNQDLIFSGVVNVGGLTTAGDGNGTIVFNGGEGSIGDIVTNGATKIRYSASTTPGAKNTYSFDTFNIAPSNGERWLIVDENVTVHGTGSDLGNDNIHATINGGWNLNGGGLEVNGTLDLAGVISFDGPGNSSIKGVGIINTTGLNISNGTTTTVQGGVTINITSNTGIKKRAGSNSTLNLADAILTATTVDWELQNNVNTVNLTNASDGTTFEAAQGRTITLTKQMGGSGKLVKAGEGTMLVKGANTYSGGTSIDAGTVTTSHATALGTGNVAVAANAVLQVNGNLTIKGDNTANHNGLDNLGSVSIADGKTLSLYALAVNKQYNLGTVNLAGASASIENTNHCGTLSLESVTGAADSTMTLFSNHSSSAATWNLGTADSGSFAGSEVVLKVGDNTATSGSRIVNYKFNNGNMFSGVDVQLENATVTHADKTMTNNVVLNAAEVRMGGINDAAADTVTDTRKWSVSKGDAAGERAKLVLDGNAKAGYSSGVKIGSAIDIEKTGTATQAFTGDMSAFHGSVDVEGGVLNILNAASVDVKDVTIGAGATLGVYNGGTATADTEHEGTLTIKNAQSLTAKGAGATLNANVVMETGSTLDVSRTEGQGIALGSALTIRENIHLSDADFEAVAGLGYGESYILFNGVDSLTLDQTYTGEITPEMRVDATGWFHGVEPEHIYMVYDGSNVGLYCYEPMPEPSTSTLSLLALAALAARRRRR